MIYGGKYWPCVRTFRGGLTKCVHMRAEGGGGQKRPKNCVRTIWTAPFNKAMYRSCACEWAFDSLKHAELYA